jgi:hypothetical protein
MTDTFSMVLGTEIVPSILSDDELAAQALAADPDAPIAPDATPFDLSVHDGSLPSWYMPPPAISARKGWHIPVVVVVIGALTLITGLGLCVTYGVLVVA